MKRRIRTIFILMTVCILGINLFQGYWLYSTYTVHRQQFSRLATEALYAAVFQYQEADVRQLFDRDTAAMALDSVRQQVVFKRFTAPHGAPGKVLIIGNDRHQQAGTRFAPGPDFPRNNRHYQVDSGQFYASGILPADTLARRISRRIVVNWFSNAPFQLQKMLALYGQELKLRGVDASFRLDTVQLAGSQPARPAKGIAAIKKETSKAYPVQLLPVLVNPIRNLHLQASFPQPAPYILQKMGGLLLTSLLLLVVTTGCFLYMLSTILRQKKLSEIKTDFINNMTHELKTPLATVSAAVEALLSFGALNDRQKSEVYLRVSRDELQRLSALVEKVLHMAEAEHKEIKIRPEAIRPADLVRGVVAKHQLQAAKPVQFDLDLSEAEKPLLADRIHVENAVSNLIDNAIKYSGEAVTIRISSHYQGKGWQLRVQDNGIGIAKSYHRAIFDRFFRVPTGNLHPVKGFGLGLSYVKQVVDKHGGSIEVRSESGQGSEFILSLPTN